ncbi:hypothetical protein HaLaN_26195 [Haematococcus lacustris]|uniref:Uncharacterized protein n=1 Tax=Haematococcus lacustris TaxID=44745 RepID=A0A6A0A5N0_HAELA|nr:hypothetical protein HaLaN_26195 [Haematococcus lacustris]
MGPRQSHHYCNGARGEVASTQLRGEHFFWVETFEGGLAANNVQLSETFPQHQELVALYQSHWERDMLQQAQGLLQRLGVRMPLDVAPPVQPAIEDDQGDETLGEEQQQQ